MIYDCDYLKFAHIFIDGSACDGCKYENYGSCCDRYKECAERIKEIMEEPFDDGFDQYAKHQVQAIFEGER